MTKVTYVASRNVWIPSQSAVPAIIELADGCIRRIETTDEASYPSRVREVAAHHTLTDYGNRWITPALVNAHTHLALTFLRQHHPGDQNTLFLVEDVFFPFESKLEPGDVRAFARIGAFEALLNGVGLVWDHYYFADEVAEALYDVGLTGVVAPTLQDLSGPGATEASSGIDLTLRIREDQRLQKAGIFAALGPHASNTVSPDLFVQIFSEARTHRLPVHMHLAQSALETTHHLGGSELGCLDFLSRLDGFSEIPHAVFAHCIFLSEKELKLLHKDQHTLVFCPWSQAQFAFPAPVHRWTEHELRWAIASDAPASNDSFDLLSEIRCPGSFLMSSVGSSPEYLRYVEKPSQAHLQALEATRKLASERSAALMDPERLLGAITDVPGSMHPDFVAGVLLPGALANLIVWETSGAPWWPGRSLPRGLAFSAPTASIHAMYVLGRLMGEPGHHRTSIEAKPEYANALQEATDRLGRLLRRAGA
jgi:5-methylthioadenosine/S-adenosylhomocysteine deaminase